MASPHVAGAAALFLESEPYASPSAVRNALLGNSTTGVVAAAGAGSPNALLYSAFIGPGDPPPGQAPAANFSFSCTNLTCNFTDESTDDLGVAAWNWAFGDGTTSASGNPSKTYAAAGTYTVRLTVTDAGGLTGTHTGSVTVSSPAGILLSARGYKIQGTKRADLTWSGAGTSHVDVFRNNVRITTTPNDGAYTDNSGQRGGGTTTYRVCESGTNNCSATVSVSY